MTSFLAGLITGMVVMLFIVVIGFNVIITKIEKAKELLK